MRKVALASLVLIATACASPARLGLARNVSAGHVQLAVHGAELFNVQRFEPPRTASLEAMLRYGISDDDELGFRFGTPGVFIEYKRQVLRAAEPHAGWDLSVSAAFGYIEKVARSDRWQRPRVDGWVPSTSLNVGRRIGQHDLSLSAGLMGQVLVPEHGPGTVGGELHATAAAGFALRLFPGLRLMPEVAVSAPLFWHSPETPVPTYMVVTGLTLLWGGGLDAPTP